LFLITVELLRINKKAVKCLKMQEIHLWFPGQLLTILEQQVQLLEGRGLKFLINHRLVL